MGADGRHLSQPCAQGPHLEAVREAKGRGLPSSSINLKKGEMASEAERLLKGSGWLPEVLRRNDLVALDGEDLCRRAGGGCRSD